MRVISSVVVVALAAGVAPAAHAAINLEFRSDQASYLVGDQVQIGLFAVGDGIGSDTLSAIDAVFSWDFSVLSLQGVDTAAPAALSAAFFPTAGDGGLNEANPPADGDGFLVGFAPFGTPIVADTSGVLLAIFEFEATTLSAATTIDLLMNGGTPLVQTRVIDGQIPGLTVTGTLSGVTIAIVPAPSAAGMLAVAGLACLRRRR